MSKCSFYIISIVTISLYTDLFHLPVFVLEHIIIFSHQEKHNLLNGSQQENYVKLNY